MTESGRAAVLFDMDGVLIDSQPIYFRQEVEMFRELGIELTPQEHGAFMGVRVRTMWSEIAARFHLSEPVDALIARSEELYLNYLQSVPVEPVAGVTQLLDELLTNGFQLALASSSSAKNIDTVLELIGLSDFFGIRISGDSVSRGKPDPEIFLRAAERLEMPPGGCVVIEDSQNGVRAAISAGMACIGYENPSSLHQDLSEATCVVKDIREITIRRIRGLVQDGRSGG